MLPCVVAILLKHIPEFKCNGLRKAVIYIIERVYINMCLTLPAFAVGVERDIAVKLHPRHIDAEKLLPYGMALSRRHIRLLIHLVLEVIDHGSVGDKCKRTRQMAVAEFARIGAEESFGIAPCKEFHTH